MAVTRLMPLKIRRGKSIKQTIFDSMNYGKDPNKTKDGELITSYGCNTSIAQHEFLLSKKIYTETTGREQKKDKDVLLYQIRQSFKPGEITPDEANRISYDLAQSFTKGRHAYIVATHSDKNHIHSHIYFNAISLDCSKKFKNFWGSAKALRRISDILCVENGLSIVENPQKKGKHYGEWLGDKRPASWRDKLKQAIDSALDGKPADFESFLKTMETAGYEIKQGKHLAFKAKEQERFIRLRSLGADYAQDEIMDYIKGRKVKIITPQKAPKFNLIINVQNSIKAKNSPGYGQWAKIHNLKEAAKSLVFLQENHLTDYAVLEEKTQQATQRFNQISDDIKAAEKRMREISELQKQISNYRRTRDIYVQYQKSGYSKKFKAENEGALILHKAAKDAFNALKLKTLPKINDLKQEYAALLADKKKHYSEYRDAKEQMQELVTVKHNIDRLLNTSQGEKEIGKAR